LYQEFALKSRGNYRKFLREKSASSEFRIGYLREVFITEGKRLDR
jgi:hypothetical protein